MKNTIFILLFAVCLEFFNSCDLFNRYIKCDKVNIPDLEWTPYANDDTLHFTDSLQNDYSLVVSGFYLNQPAGYYTSSDCGDCSNNWGFSLENSAAQIKIEFNFHLNTGEISSDNYFIKNNSKSSYMRDNNLKIDCFENMEINGKYFKYIKVVSDSLGNNKLIFAKNYGLILIEAAGLEIYNKTAKYNSEGVSLKSINYSDSGCN